MAFMAAAAPYLMAASTGMSILGAANQSAAQRQAGEVAYQNALARQQVANVEARQMEINAGQEQAAAQRQAEEQRRKGMLLASRMRAVMGASGAGIDNNLIASLAGEGEYAADTALFNSDERARGLRNKAAMTRWSGDTGVWSGANDKAAADRAATSTLVGGVAQAGLSFASKYGGDLDGVSFKSVDGDITKSADWMSRPMSWRAPGFDDNWNALAE